MECLFQGSIVREHEPGHSPTPRMKLGSWVAGFQRAIRKLCDCGRPRMSMSLYCGPCWKKERDAKLRKAISVFPPGTGRLGVVEPAEHSPRNPPFLGGIPRGFLALSHERGEGFTVPAGFAALGE